MKTSPIERPGSGGATKHTDSVQQNSVPSDSPWQQQRGVEHSHDHFHEGHTAGLRGAEPPPSFKVGKVDAHYADLHKVDAHVTFDVATGRASVEAKVKFELTEPGYPVFDLDPDVDSLKIGTKEEDPALFMAMEPPGEPSERGEPNVRVVKKVFPPGVHTVELKYDLPESKFLQFKDGGVDFFQRATDLTPGYSEQFFPSNLQYDQYAGSFKVSIKGASSEHRVFANGTMAESADGTVSIEYPEHYNTSSFYLHVTDPKNFHIVEDTFEGLEGSIPITVYGRDEETVKKAVEDTKNIMAELEADYGPYPHPEMLVRIEKHGVDGILSEKFDDDGNSLGARGGMEYAGATITAPHALGHEITHSWFARGVLAGGGNSGWIDEAIARWRDREYPRAEKISLDAEEYPQLAGYDPHRRVTARESYGHGSDVLSEIDFILRDHGGMKPVLREVFQRYDKKTLTSEKLLSTILEHTPENDRALVELLFEVKIFGRRMPTPEERELYDSSFTANNVPVA